MHINKNPLTDSWELAESEETTRPSVRKKVIPCKANTILIVDDEESIRGVTKLVLEKSLPDNVIYDCACDGHEAVKMYQGKHHKVILMDLSMPVLDGEKASHMILDLSQESGWEPPAIIFRTGYAPPNDVRNLVATDPAHCLLRKPVRNQTLIMAVSKRLGLRPNRNS